MIYTKGLKKETLEKLADLWEEPNFQELVRILRINQDNYAKLCLTRTKWEDVMELQYKASAISTIVKTVEESFKRINKQ
jgi:hypothetical protein